MTSLGRAVAVVVVLSALFGAMRSAYANDVHKASPDASAVRGGIVYRTYCVLCHGATAEGNGRAARLYNPPPANLVRSPYNNEYWELIIRRGGGAMGRSTFMPPWGEQLTDEQITDVVVFLRALNKVQ